MIKKYIRGNNLRGKEVIAELEKLGGCCDGMIDGTSIEHLYFINKRNEIDLCNKNSQYSELIIECFEEIKLPEPFISDEIVFYSEPSYDDCEGCFFDGNQCALIGTYIKCDNKIYKLKK